MNTYRGIAYIVEIQHSRKPSYRRGGCVKVQVYTDPELIAEIQARSVRAPERDVDNVTCWREESTDHYFIDGYYWYSLSWIPVREPTC